jgi:hypothetical protein
MSQKEWRKPRLPDRLARLLRAKRSRDPQALWWIETDAECTDRQTGALLAAYLFNELSDQERRVFERHVQNCIFCGAVIHDASELRRGRKTHHARLRSR